MKKTIKQIWTAAIAKEPYFKHHFIEDNPFADEFIHAIITGDEKSLTEAWRKMSKFIATSELNDKMLLHSLVKLKSAIVNSPSSAKRIIGAAAYGKALNNIEKSIIFASDLLIKNDENAAETHQEETTNILNLMLKALENIGEGIVIIEPRVNGQILFINKTLETISGYQRDHLLGKNFSTLFGKFYTPQLEKEIFPAALKTGWQGEVSQQRIDHLPVSTYLHIQPVLDDNRETMALVGIMRDITREKRHLREMELREEQITWQNLRLTFLEDLSTLLNATLDIKETLVSFSRKFFRIFPYRALSFFLPVDTRKRHFRVFFSSENNEHFDFPKSALLHFKESPLEEFLNDQSGVCFQITAESYPKHAYFNNLSDKQIHELTSFPIVFQDELLGILNICPDKDSPFSQEDLVFLEQIKRHLTVALKNCIQFDQLERQNRKLNFFYNLFSYIKNNVSSNFILNEALIDLTIAFSYDHLAIYQVSGKGGKRLAHHSTVGISAELFPENIQIEEQLPNSPTLWIDAAKTNPLKTCLGKAYDDVNPKSILVLKDNSVFRGEVLLIGLGNGYLPDLSYSYHVDIMRGILKELTLALDHVLLFQQTAQSEREWKTTFDEVQIGLVAVDRNFTIKRANKTFWKIFECEEQTAQKCRTFFDVNKHQSDIKKASYQNISDTIEWTIFETEKQLSRRFFPFFNKKREFIGGIFTVQDVTEERLREKRIHYLSRFPEVSPQIVMSLNLDGEVIYANATAKGIVEKLQLESVRKLTPVTLMFELQSNTLQAGISQEYIQKFEDLVFQFYAYMPPGEDNIYLYGMDMTERQELQEKLIQTERMRIIGEVASGAAHDFNNFLMTIMGRSQLMLMNTDDETIIEEIKIIEKAARDGAEMVKRLQELTPSHGKQSKEFKHLYLDSVIKDSLLYSFQKIKPATQLKGHETKINTDLENDIVVFGNPVELKEVFTNLIFNATDAMPDGGTLAIKAQIDREEKTAVVSVKDSGVGMPANIRQKIFDPFFTTKGKSGTGLGLSLVYKIITSHDGTIQVNSQSGRGTEFIIRLPFSEKKPYEEAPVKDYRQISTSHNTNLLVIDDEIELLMTIAEVLKLKFNKVDMASSGKEALERVSRERYDVILTDLGMPEMSGWDVAKKVKNVLPKSKVILVTGWGNQAEEELINHEYVDQILSKPYDLHQLLKVIEQIIAKN